MTKFSTAFAILVSLFGLALWAGPMPSDYRQVGPYNAVVIENVKGAPYVVYLHGYGGSGYDVFEDQVKKLIQRNHDLRKLNWILPDASGGSWFNMLGADIDIAKWDADLRVARGHLRAMLKAAGIDPHQVIWAGFSQGAITAIDFVLHSQIKPLGLIIDSGLYHKSVNNSNVLKGVKFQMIHDPNDDILPFDEARKLETMLRDKNGMVGEIQKTSTGHIIHTSFLKKSLQNLERTRLQSACARFYYP